MCWQNILKQFLDLLILCNINCFSLPADVNCFGYDCYPLAFGVPAILMILSLLLFVAGSRLYKKVPPEGNVVVQVSSAVGVRLFLYHTVLGNFSLSPSHLHTDTWSWADAHAHMHKCTHILTHVQKQICHTSHTHTCTHAHACTCTCTCMQACTGTRTHACTHVHAHTCMCTRSSIDAANFKLHCQGPLPGSKVVGGN